MRRKPIILATASVSEVKDREKIDKVALAAENTQGSVLLNVFPHIDQGRTLITVGGTLEGVSEAIYNLTDMALKLFVMPKKSPCIGVVDTVFFVPIHACTLEECKQLSKRFAKRIYQNHQIPFFYHNYKNHSLYHEFMKLLMERGLRGLKERIENGIIKPTLGGTRIPAKQGVLFTFARKPHVRFIINISTFDPDVSFRLSQRFDSSSHAKLWAAETKIEGGGDSYFVIPEKFKGIMALGAANDYLKHQQVNILIYDLDSVGLHELYESMRYEVDNFGAEILSSEIFGLIPKEPLIRAGQFYSGKERTEAELIKLAAEKLKLSGSDTFVPETKIIEYLVEGK